MYLCVKSLQSCLTICDPIVPGYTVHAILQAGTRVGWHALIQGIFPTQVPCVSCLLNWQAGSLPLAPLGKPPFVYTCVCK